MGVEVEVKVSVVKESDIGKTSFLRRVIGEKEVLTLGDLETRDVVIG